MEPKTTLPDGVRLIRGDRMIEGVHVRPLRRIPDERGTIFHMLRETDEHFERFGEIYFSTVYPGVVKGWHRHLVRGLNYACIFGRIKLAIFDDRDTSLTKGSLMEIFIGQDSYNLVQMPPGIWNGFKGVSEPYAIVANCSTQVHDPAKSFRLDPFENHIPYDWKLRQD
jgi:dTDP-4-dehydrorhamnose 3,5-epimerase